MAALKKTPSLHVTIAEELPRQAACSDEGGVSGRLIQHHTAHAGARWPQRVREQEALVELYSSNRSFDGSLLRTRTV